ncbi:MAG: hypothetical protein R3C99_12345 [Pirellulaceae bacterium]
MRAMVAKKAIKAVEERLAQQLARIWKRLSAAKDAPKSAEPMDDEQLKELVEQAYLRSLTRYPDEREMGRSLFTSAKRIRHSMA